jgi:hypothetical protein
MITQRFGGALALAVLGLSLTGGGVALAATTDAPVAGTTACTNLVNVQSDVIAARATLQADVNTLNADLRATPVVDATVAADRAKVAQDQAHLDVVVGNVTASLCTGTTTADPATVDPTPAPVTPRARPVQTVAQIDDAIDALSCTSSNADVLAVDRAIAARQVQHLTRPRARRPTQHPDRLARTAPPVPPAAPPPQQSAKACGCVLPTTVVTPAPVVEAPVTEAPVTLSPATPYSAVVPTQDDNSVATTSGSQIADVPVGSAQTGAA